MGYKKFIRNTSGQNNKDKTVINSPQFEKRENAILQLMIIRIYSLVPKEKLGSLIWSGD